MQELLDLYTEFLKAAQDHQIPLHLANLVTDAADLAAATKAVIEQARQRGESVQAQTTPTA